MIRENILVIAIAAAVLVLIAALAIIASRKRPVYKQKGQLLLLNEQRFLVALLQALPPDTILTFKVRLLDIVSSTDARTGKSLDEDLADYVVDFVLVDRNTTNVKLCIEMDAESSNAAERLTRQTMVSRALRRAGITHLRLPLVRFYDPHRIREVIYVTLKEAAAHAASQPKV